MVNVAHCVFSSFVLAELCVCAFKPILISVFSSWVQVLTAKKRAVRVTMISTMIPSTASQKAAQRFIYSMTVASTALIFLGSGTLLLCISRKSNFIAQLDRIDARVDNFENDVDKLEANFDKIDAELKRLRETIKNI